ncbi:MAG: hypothetical protein GY858_09855 [Candidatus Omnitrophica bacterium]|nr:hypothetical protein [Candidatus Omnitrophota bacterium]
MKTAEAFAHLADTADRGVKKIVEDKRKKDAFAELPVVWSDFLLSTSEMMEEAQNHLEVASDAQGQSGCLVNFPGQHKSYKESGKGLSQHVFERYDEHSKDLLNSIKNPVLKEGLQSRIGGYRGSLAEHLARTEAKLVHEKRYYSTIEGLERLEQATYKTPCLFKHNLATITESINSLEITLPEKTKLIKTAGDRLASSVGLGLLQSDPQQVLQVGIEDSFKKHLTPEQIFSFETKASNLLEQQKNVVKREIKDKFKVHLREIQKKGKGAEGLLSLAGRAFGEEHPEYIKMKNEETLELLTFRDIQELKAIPYEEGLNLVEARRPKDGDSSYLKKYAVYEKLRETLAEQNNQLRTDPAGFVWKWYSDELGLIESGYKQLRFIQEKQKSKGVSDPKFLTNEQKQSFLTRLKTEDPKVLALEIEKITSQGTPSHQIGLDILNEVVQDDSLESPIYFYARSKMLGQPVKNELAEVIGGRKQLFSGQSNEEKNTLEEKIKGSPIYKNWARKTMFHQSYNNKEVIRTYEGIRSLARHYILSNICSDAKEAVNRASEKLILDNYDYEDDFFQRGCLNTLMLPKKIIHDGEVHKIDRNKTRNGLLELRKKIIKSEAGVDLNKSFPKLAKNMEHLEENRQAKIDNALRSGSFFLGRDGKAVYFVAYDELGKQSYPLRKQNGEKLKFNLVP